MSWKEKKQRKVVTQESGWADNMSQVDFGSWIKNDFEKWITLKVAIPSANRAGRTAANLRPLTRWGKQAPVGIMMITAP